MSIREVACERRGMVLGFGEATVRHSYPVFLAAVAFRKPLSRLRKIACRYA